MIFHELGFARLFINGLKKNRVNWETPARSHSSFRGRFIISHFYICLLLFCSAIQSNEVIAQNSGSRLDIKQDRALKGRLVYWLQSPDNSKTERKVIPTANSSGMISLELPSKFNQPGTVLKVLDLTQHRMACLPVPMKESRNSLGINLIKNGEFNSLDSWNHETTRKAGLEIIVGQAAPTQAAGKSVRLEIFKKGETGSDAIFYQNGLGLIEGEPYTLTFWSRADTVRPLVISLENQDDNQNEGLLVHVPLSREWRKFTYTLVASHTAEGRNRFCIHAGGDVGRIEVAQVQLQHGRVSTSTGPSLLKNGDFQHGGDDWRTVLKSLPAVAEVTFPDNSEVASPSPATGKVMRFSVLEKSDKPESICLFQSGTDLHDGDTYSVSFQAKTNHTRTIVVEAYVDETDAHSVGLHNRLTLTEDWRKYVLYFTANSTIQSANRLAFLMGDAVGTVDIANISLRKGIEEMPTITSESNRQPTLSDQDFQLAETVRVPITYHGSSVREVKVMISSGGKIYGTRMLKSTDNGMALFSEIPLGAELTITIINGGSTKLFTRFLDNTSSRTLSEVSLPDEWENVKLLAYATRKLTSTPLVGSWESYDQQDTVTGKEFQHQEFLFNPDGTGTLSITTVNPETEAPTSPSKIKSFYWSLGQGAHSVVLGTNVYAWSISSTGDQVKQLSLKGDTGKTYILFRN